MKITAQMIATLKKATGGVSLEACKKALHAANGKFEQAIEALKKAGEAVAMQRADRTASEGIVSAFVNLASATKEKANTGAIIEINCETDFVSNTEDFKNFTTDVVQLAANKQLEKIDALSHATLKDTQTVEQARQELVGKVRENIKVSHLHFIKTVNHIGHYIHKNRYGCLVELKGGNAPVAREISVHIVVNSPQQFSDLLDQPFYKDPSKTIKEYLQEHQAQIIQFHYLMLGQSPVHYVAEDSKV